jgi:tetratricopeptide (TPR) repeat protein
LAAIWRSRPVFVTSTFRDMHAERDWLRSRVFPALEERLKARFHYLETIDLRWGVDSASGELEDDRELAVLSVCLNEIERSRPFLIGLLGDRYGWRPSPARITRAAREAGVTEDMSGKSVTELEILHGVLRSPGQQRRSWFYLREPLDYDAMPPAVAARYSDRYSGEADAVERADKLAALKQELARALPGRVRRYRVGWDAGRQALKEVDLEVWGAQVLDDLWSDLEAETADFLRAAPTTWQDQDRWALDEFIEGRTRGFVGRTKVIEDLIDLATSAAADGAVWGTCVTSEAGGGKSSLFGYLSRRLQQKDVLVLAHAAGISVRSTQVDWMLRRWVGELAATLEQADPLGEQSTPDEIDQAFSRLLHQASQIRRVVVLLDALNQFEPTTRATHLTWLPRLWPVNARLVATAIPGTQSQALLHRTRTTETPLAPVDEGSALEIVRGICARYHRTLNTRVETSLLRKRTPGGAPALGNPLWLEIATEELNLLDAQAFDRAEADPSIGSGGDAVVGLLLSTVEQMPGDVEGLYGFMLNRTERQFGPAWTRAFVEAIGVSRSGWRESDLEALMPRLSGDAWDPLRFATLRRALRAHVVQRGAHAQWDFAHAQMRKAVAMRMAREQIDATVLHREIGRYLLGLDREDRLHETETMVHLMQMTDLREAALFYGGELTAGEADGATAALKMHLLEGRVNAVIALTDQRVDATRRADIAGRFVSPLTDAVENTAPLEVRRLLQQAGNRTLIELAAAEPSDTDLQRALSVSHNRLGSVLADQGNPAGARAAFQASLAVAERLAAIDPRNAGWQRDIAACHNHVGTLLTAQGNLAGALEAFQGSLAIAKSLAAADPANPDWQRNLAISHGHVGDVLKAQGNLSGALAAFQATLAICENLVKAGASNIDWQRDLAFSHERLGAALEAQGDLPRALAEFQASFVIVERLAATDPGNHAWQRDLAVNHAHLGEVLKAQGHVPGALAAFRAKLEICERLAAIDPGEVNWQRDFANAQIGLGDLLMTQDLSGALAAFQASLAVVERLASAYPDNVGAQRHLAGSHERIGHVHKAQGNLARALASFQTSLAIIERLASSNANNTNWQRDLSVAHEELSDVLSAQGNLEASMTELQASHAIAERLAATDPANTGWQRDLYVSHSKVGSRLRTQGNLTGALVAFQTSHEIVKRLATSDPSNTEWLRDLSVSHQRLGDVLAAQGDVTEARDAFEAGLAISARLAAMDPGNAGYQRDLATDYIRIGDLLTGHGELDGAIAAFQASLVIADCLTADPRNTHCKRRLAVSFIRLGNQQSAQGNLAGALAAVQTSFAVVERLAASEPANTELQGLLAVCHDQLGDVLMAQGQLTRALGEFRASLAISEGLAAADSGWQSDLVALHTKVGDALKAQEHLPAALAAYQAALAIAERLAATDPANTAWQRNLSVGHERIGDVLRVQGRFADALAAFRANLAIIERLAATDPANTDWQRDLEISHSKLGDLLNHQGHLAEALGAIRASLAIREHFAATDPSNTGWQRDLSVSHNKVGEMLQAQGDLPGALAAFRASLAIAESLAATDPANTRWQRDLVVSTFNLACLLQLAQDEGRPLVQILDLLGEQAAADYWRSCHTVLRRMKAAGMFLDPPLTQLLEQLERIEPGSVST